MTRLLALLTLLATASAAVASGPAVDHTAVPFANGYWSAFIDYWTKWIQNRNAVLFTVLIAGAIGIFIVSRTKKLK